MHECPNAMLMETVRAYYKGWYGRFIDPNLHIEGGYLYAPQVLAWERVCGPRCASAPTLS